jgi:hypothetical protein
MTNAKTREERGFREVLQDDFRKGDFRKRLRREYDSLKDFYIDEERRAILQQMRWFKRNLYTFGWLLKALFFKLTPTRRLLFVIAAVLAVLPNNWEFNNAHIFVEFNSNILTGCILLLIIMLELKDKLVAQSELEAGRAVQTALLPKRAPEVPGWSLWLFSRTANEVGGDMIDFQALENRKYRVALADVAGKGLSAALLAAKLQATLRALAPDHDSLAEVCSKLNRIFHRDSLRSFFASCVYMEIVESNGAVRLVNAGHLPPIIVRSTGSEELPKGDAAVGIFPETNYSEHSIELTRGEMLLVYSDGLTEAKNEAGDFYGSERLARLVQNLPNLSATEAGEKIVREVTQFIGEAPVSDDLSLAILKRIT